MDLWTDACHVQNNLQRFLATFSVHAITHIQMVTKLKHEGREEKIFRLAFKRAGLK